MREWVMCGGCGCGVQAVTRSIYWLSAMSAMTACMGSERIIDIRVVARCVRRERFWRLHCQCPLHPPVRASRAAGRALAAGAGARRGEEQPGIAEAPDVPRLCVDRSGGA